MQHFTNPKNPKNLPIDLIGVRQLDLENQHTPRDTTPTVRPPHDGKTYRDKNGDPHRKN